VPGRRQIQAAVHAGYHGLGRVVGFAHPSILAEE
jgi:hypothetical protein